MTHCYSSGHFYMCMNTISVCVCVINSCIISRVFKDPRDLQEPKELQESQWVYYLST